MIKNIQNYFLYKKLLNRLMNDIEVKKTSIACPEQYEFFYEGVLGAYLRLRNGIVSIRLTPAGSINYTSTIVFAKNLDKVSGCFSSDTQKNKYVSLAKKLLAKHLIADAIVAKDIKL
jgi:hypothetical protein